MNDESLTEEAHKGRKEFVAWIQAHKNQCILISISVLTIIAAILGIKNGDDVKALWKNLNEKIKKANMYSSRWYETVTNED